MSKLSNVIKTVLVFVALAVAMGVFNFQNFTKNVLEGNFKEILNPKSKGELKNEVDDTKWDSKFYINRAAVVISTKDMLELGSKLPTVTEAERFDHPYATDSQLRAAKAIYQSEIKVDDEATKSSKHVSSEDDQEKNKINIFVISDHSGFSKVTYQNQVVKVYDQASDTDLPIPALLSGELPVFTDQETALYKPEMMNQELNEIDFRRAYWWFKNHKREPIPQMPEDLKARAQEEIDRNIKEEDARDYDTYKKRYNARHGGMDVTINERLTKASEILIKLNLAN